MSKITNDGLTHTATVSGGHRTIRRFFFAKK